VKIRYEPVAVMRNRRAGLTGLCRNTGKNVIGVSSEKADLRRAESKYPGDKILLSPRFLRGGVTAGAGRERANKQRKSGEKMNRNRLSKALFLILCLIVAAAAVIGLAGCKNKQETTPAATSEITQSITDAPDATTSEVMTEAATEETKNVLGEGATVFTFNVTDKDGNTKSFEVHTDETTVGAALLKVGIIAGDTTQYGLYVKTVDGITLDYDTDKMYWAFYVGGAYASTGVDSTNVQAGEVYEFRAAK